VLGHIGLKDVTVIRAEGVNISPDARQTALNYARRAISEIDRVKLAA
jgi:FMN-dependent NADH-azoreductase